MSKELNPKDFRIGNYVEYDGRIFQMHCIHPEHPGLETMEFGFGVVEWKDIKPIELNLKMLTNLGFDDSEYKKGFTGIDFKNKMIFDFVLKKPKYMGDWQDYYAYDLGDNRFIPLKYVHQLQNLFHAITGNHELKMENKTKFYCGDYVDGEPDRCGFQCLKCNN